MASIKKRPDGKWRARYRDAEGNEHARHFRRQIDAKKWLDGVTAAVVTGAYVDPNAGKITLATYFGDWSQRQIWATGTATAMSLAVRHCTFADVELGSLKPSHVELWVKTMDKAGLAPGTIRTRVNNVKSVLHGAKKDRLIAGDPADGVTLPRRRKAEHAMEIPTPEDVGRILASSEQWFEVFVSLCAFAGLRLGEACAVQLVVCL